MSDVEERDAPEHGGGGAIHSTGGEAIKWSAIVLIVFSILYFLARFVIPLIG